jgi:TolB protein
MRSLAGAAVAGIALLAGAAGQNAPPHAPAGTIAFSAGPLEPDRSHVYIVGADGAGPRQVTSGGIDFDPALSRDGKRIVFRGRRDGNDDIYRVKVDGTGLLRLTADPGMDYAPSWAPDGKSVAFASMRGGDYPHIWVMDPNGRHPHRVSSITGEYPAFSPDGKRIAFANNRGSTDAGFEIYVMDADGSHVRRLTRNAFDDMGPGWSPDGRLIAFHRSRGGAGNLPDVYVMRPDGSHQRRLTHGGGELPSWSPDGRFLVYAGTAGLTIVRPDGRVVRRLSLHVAEPSFPSWGSGSPAASP